MNIIVTTFYYENFQKLADKTCPNRMVYCAHHSYYSRFRVFREPLTGDGYKDLCEAGKTQARSLLKVLEENPECDYVFNLHVDAVVTDFNQKLEGLIEFYKGADIVTSRDKGGIQTSQMLIKNSPASRKYFKKCVDYCDHGGEHDQRFFQENPRPFIVVSPQRTMNSYDTELRQEPFDEFQTWQDGDFIVHLAGSSLERRMGVIDKWLGRVK